MKIRAIKGDITELAVDVIVNAANSGLLGGGGVDGAIHRAAGPALLDECRLLVARIGSCPPGQVAFTGAGRLHAKYVAHAVGPIWSGGGRGEGELLRSCYIEALEGAEKLGAASIAFPCISTGVYGYPKRPAAQVAVDALRDFASRDTALSEAIVVAYDDESYGIYAELLSS